VVDASVLPDIPRANTHLTVVAVAERIADRIADRLVSGVSSPGAGSRNAGRATGTRPSP
jgi:choline dehydrogenase-like flavoprotein